MVEQEIWKDIPNYDGIYQASNLGRIRNAKTLSIRKPINYGPYYTLQLSINGNRKLFLVHKLIAATFIPNPLNKREINHIDGNKHNNRVDNLEWVTRKENAMHSAKTGLQTKEQFKKANSCAIAKTQKPLLQIKNGKVIARYKSLRDACRKLKMSSGYISDFIKGKTRCKKAYGYEWRYEL